MCDLFGLIVYISMMIFLFISIYVILIKRNYFFLFLSMLFTVIISAMRGTSGVDTIMYITRFHNIHKFSDISFVECLVPILMWITKNIGGNFIIFSLVYGLIVSSLYLYIFRKVPYSIYFGFLSFPVIFIDSLFNGIRIGLAYPMIFLSIYYSSKIFFISAICSHISSLLVSVFGVIQRRLLIILIIGIALYFSVYHVDILNLLSDRYKAKLLQYQILHPKNIYSGLADISLLFVIFIIYLRTIGFRGKRFIVTSIYIFISILIIHILIVSKYVFMLRIIRLLDISLLAVVAKKSYRLDRLSLKLSFAFGIFYMLNFIRQIISSCNYSIGGFLPLNLIVF